MESKNLQSHTTNIPGLLLWEIPTHGDNRGWFKENWQREKMTHLGLKNFSPVQNNISFNSKVGTTRGLHAEPWDKFISVATGSVFGAWVDLREGPNFGAVFTTTITPDKAIFVPRGVANGFQTLEPDTAYTYLVNDHWSANLQDKYTFVNLADTTLNIPWPIPLDKAELSAKDKEHLYLNQVKPMKDKKVLILGANGQLGKELQKIFPTADALSRAEFNIFDTTCYAKICWSDYSTIINAAAYTKVDEAETASGRELAWQINARAVALLSSVAKKHDVILVHISSDYVFGGSETAAYTEEDPVCPLGVYGQSKAAGDFAVSVLDKYYVLRTSWVIGSGNNFVKTMANLAAKNVSPSVVNDQIGRLSFTSEIALGIKYLLDSGAPFGVYNLSGSGKEHSWADIASRVYELLGKDPNMVCGVSTAEFFAGKSNISPRPANSVLDLSKIIAAGFTPKDSEISLQDYVESLRLDSE